MASSRDDLIGTLLGGLLLLFLVATWPVSAWLVIALVVAGIAHVVARRSSAGRAVRELALSASAGVALVGVAQLVLQLAADKVDPRTAFAFESHLIELRKRLLWLGWGAELAIFGTVLALALAGARFGWTRRIGIAALVATSFTFFASARLVPVTRRWEADLHARRRAMPGIDDARSRIVAAGRAAATLRSLPPAAAAELRALAQQAVAKDVARTIARAAVADLVIPHVPAAAVADESFDAEAADVLAFDRLRAQAEAARSDAVAAAQEVTGEPEFAAALAGALTDELVYAKDSGPVAWTVDATALAAEIPELAAPPELPADLPRLEGMPKIDLPRFDEIPRFEEMPRFEMPKFEPIEIHPIEVVP